MKDVSTPIAEKYHIHRTQLFFSTRMKHHYVFPITQQRKHRLPFQAETDGIPLGYLSLHPGKKLFIGQLLHHTHPKMVLQESIAASLSGKQAK